MAIKAPWNGWLRKAMPAVSLLILVNATIILFLAILNAATIDLYFDGVPKEVSEHRPRIMAQIVFYWCMLPFVLLIVAAAETYALFSNQLRPQWCMLTSITATGAWLVQFSLWGICLIPEITPGWCPYYPGMSFGNYPSWNTASPGGPWWAILTIFVCYIVQMSFAAVVVNRQRRTTFRKSDLRGSWALKEEMATVRQVSASSERNLLAEELEDCFTDVRLSEDLHQMEHESY